MFLAIFFVKNFSFALFKGEFGVVLHFFLCLCKLLVAVVVNIVMELFLKNKNTFLLARVVIKCDLCTLSEKAFYD